MDQVWLWVALALLVVAVAAVLLLRGRSRSEEFAEDRNEAMSTAVVAAAGGAVGAVGAAGVAAAAASREAADAAESDEGHPDEGRAAEPQPDGRPSEAAEQTGVAPTGSGSTARAPEDAGPSRQRSAPLGSALAALDAQSAATAGPSAFELAAAVVSAEVTRPGPYAGSALPAADGSSPSPEYPVKANVGSRRYYPPDSPYYVRTRGDLWFRAVTDAEGAGFTAWNAR